MDKYAGCNVVESVVKSGKSVEIKTKKRRYVGIVVRFAVAAVIIGIICLAAYAPLPFLSEVRDVLKSVFCYDVFGRDEFGIASALSGLFGGA